MDIALHLIFTSEFGSTDTSILTPKSESSEKHALKKYEKLRGCGC